jgi:hypothetical protein
MTSFSSECNAEPVSIPDEVRSDIGTCQSLSHTYKQICEIYDWDQLYNIVFDVVEDSPDNSIRILEALREVTIPSITTVYGEILDKHTWFIHDYYNEKDIYIARNPITGEKDFRCRRGRRVYFWEDDGTNYEALTQTVVNTFGVIDDWYTKTYTEDDEGCQDILAKVVHSFDVLLEMYDNISEEDIDEDCDSVS